MSKRDQQQKEYWKNIVSYIITQEQREVDALNIDLDREQARAINDEKYKWLLDNWQLNRPNKKTQHRRIPINILSK